MRVISHQDRGPERRISITVIAYDFSSVFSLITGILSSSGMDITEGEIFTGRKRTRKIQKQRGSKRRRRPEGLNVGSRLIVDRFKGFLREERNIADWLLQLDFNFREIFRKLVRDNDPLSAKEYVNERVARALYQLKPEVTRILYPIKIDFDNSDPNYTRMTVQTEDTPFFLYAMGTALSLQGISIENVSITTHENRVLDDFLFVTNEGKKITEPKQLDRIKLSVLLTKQFTYFLSQSPSPYSALLRFEELLQRVLDLPGKGRLLEMLFDVDTLKYLARLLGISDFLWEDFIRLQYETLIPMLKPHARQESFSDLPEQLCKKLDEVISREDTLEGKERVMNEYKDRQIFLMDLNHILLDGWDLKKLSINLTRLAECVVDKAFDLAYRAMKEIYGVPRSVAGLEAKYAVMGLGKFGGVALGYASDIEILFLYSDQGRTDGEKSLENSEFFEELVKRATKLIHAKREGIFHIDLRLRPFGSAGPLACSLERFCKYYGRGGKSHSYERLALVRMRRVGGDYDFGKMVERLRDEIVYTEDSIDLKEIRSLRARQYREKCKGGRLNAKFSPGALVDLEYAVQMLQVIHGSRNNKLRTPVLHDALERMVKAKILEREDFEQIADAYYFLRRLINALRMLRGSAKDLFLPESNSREYEHLARRMGYTSDDRLTASQRLNIDFETKTALIRKFLNRYFGRESVPGKGFGNIADLVLSSSIDEETVKKILLRGGFRDIRRAYKNFRNLGGSGERRNLFAKLAVLASDILRRVADPDVALNNWERFAGILNNPQHHFEVLLSQPKRLEIMLKIFSDSEFLANTLIRNPEFFEWVTLPENVGKVRTRESITMDFMELASSADEDEEWMNALRIMKRREILRIGTRDLCLGKPIEEIMFELSELAESCIRLSLGRATGEEQIHENLCILAFGKLGGRELNYSSDIDLFFVYDDTSVEDGFREKAADVARRVRVYLSGHTAEGYAYRVDLRLRPYGSSGELVQPVTSVIEYFKKNARPWEVQALIKLRPVGGNIKLGESIVSVLREVAFERYGKNQYKESISKMRVMGEKGGNLADSDQIDVKNGRGGIRDIEFLLQGLQLFHLAGRPGEITGNTLEAMDKLVEMKILGREEAEELREHYLFLRRVEHYLQIYGDRQKHAITQDDLEGIAKRMVDSTVKREDFIADLNHRLERVRDYFIRTLSPE